MYVNCIIIFFLSVRDEYFFKILFYFIYVGEMFIFIIGCLYKRSFVMNFILEYLNVGFF